MLYVVRKKHRIYSINDSFPLETSHLRQGNEHLSVMGAIIFNILFDYFD
jgi:hypothetical protein